MSRTAVLEERVAGDLAGDLAGGPGEAVVAEAAVAEALRSKHPDDAVPAPVWWLVVDALRRSLDVSGGSVTGDHAIAAAVVAVERAVWALSEDGLVLHSTDGGWSRWVELGDPVRALHRAQVLVARLVVSPGSSSPTLLKVRLDRLARALVANLQPAE
jgi:hypothetical protein